MKNPFEFIFSIVTVVCLFKFLRYALDRRMAFRDAGFGAGAELDKRLEKIEQRIANLETIVIERDKKNEFERSL
jgi:hypothetical protein